MGVLRCLVRSGCGDFRDTSRGLSGLRNNTVMHRHHLLSAERGVAVLGWVTVTELARASMTRGPDFQGGASSSAIIRSR